MGGTHNNLLHLTAETVPIYPVNQFSMLYICFDGNQIASAASEQHVMLMKQKGNMSKRIVINCFIVSLVFSVIAPFFTIATFVPEEGEVAYDLNDSDFEKLEKMSPE